MNKKISVIVPIYNASKSLNKCIESIRNQTYNNIEIILIDDGSKDNSFEICNSYTELDSRIIVIHQENQGVSVARNNGLKKSTGDFIIFVDSDDFLDEKACEIMLKEIIDNNCDISISNKDFYIGDKILKNILYKENHFLREEKEKELFILDLMTPYFDEKMNDVKYLSCGVTAKIFKSEIIKNNNIYFQENCRFGEDVIFNLYCFQHAKKISYINADTYHFCVNNDSSTHKFRNDWIDSHIIFMNCIDDFIRFYDKDERFQECSEMMKVTRISSLAVSYFFHKNNPSNFIESYKIFLIFIKNDEYNEAVKKVKNYLLTSNQKKIVFLLRNHMSLLFAIICYIRNCIRKV